MDYRGGNKAKRRNYQSREEPLYYVCACTYICWFYIEPCTDCDTIVSYAITIIVWVLPTIVFEDSNDKYMEHKTQTTVDNGNTNGDKLTNRYLRNVDFV